MKYNGKSPMNEKILKGIIIAFPPSLVSSRRRRLVEQESEGRWMRQKKSFAENLIGLLSQFSKMTFTFFPPL